MNIYKKQWEKDFLKTLDISWELFPKIAYADEIAANVTKKAESETGYIQGTKVYVGMGDAGASTLASGISQKGEYNIQLGTSSWVAGISNTMIKKEGIFHLAGITKDTYINVVPFLNGGNVYQWATDIFAEGNYGMMEKLLQKAEKSDVLCLPYFAGERFPILDEKASGMFFGIKEKTTKADLAKSVLEGCAFFIRQGIETMGEPIQKISMIGGGARSKIWCQIMADILQKTMIVYEDSTFLAIKALAMFVMETKKKIIYNMLCMNQKKN